MYNRTFHNYVWPTPTNDNVRRKVSVRSEELDYCDFEGTLSNIKERIDEMILKYGADAQVDHEYYREPYSDSDQQYSRFNLLTVRDETDEEYNTRLKETAERNAAIHERDLAEFKRLEKKFNKG